MRNPADKGINFSERIVRDLGICGGHRAPDRLQTITDGAGANLERCRADPWVGVGRGKPRPYVRCGWC